MTYNDRIAQMSDSALAGEWHDQYDARDTASEYGDHDAENLAENKLYIVEAEIDRRGLDINEVDG